MAALGTTFRDWLARHRHADTALGDLARDAARDRRWRGDTPESLRRAMARAPASLRALADAGERYRFERELEIDELLMALDADLLEGTA